MGSLSWLRTNPLSSWQRRGAASCNLQGETFGMSNAAGRRQPGLSQRPRHTLPPPKPAGLAVPALRHGAHYPLAQEAPGTGVGSWQHPHAPAGASELTGSFLALINVMENHFLCPFPSATHASSSTLPWPVGVLREASPFQTPLQNMCREESTGHNAEESSNFFNFFYKERQLAPGWSRRVAVRAAELCSGLGDTSAPAGSCQLLTTPCMLFLRGKQPSGAPTPSPTSRRGQGLLHTGNGHPTAAPALGKSVPLRHVLPGTAPLCLLRTGFALSLPAFCCLLQLKQNREVTTFAASVSEGCAWSQSPDGWWVGGWRKSGTEIPAVGLM